ncbi:MAG: hypothetical protein ACE5IW_04475 [bacterium]
MAKAKSPEILAGRKVYVPRMSYSASMAIAAALRSVGIDAEVTPESDERTLELGAKYLSGDECFPAKVTMGDFLKIMERFDFDTSRIAFFMAATDGPCRFGQYVPLMKKVFRQLGVKDEVVMVAPSSSGGYQDLDDYGSDVTRTAWLAVVASDILRKLLLKIRPYELNKGETEQVFEESLNHICKVLEKPNLSHRARLELLIEALVHIRERFRKIPAEYARERPLIGIVGEIFCRLNTFSNHNLVKIIEEHGGEAWLSDIGEWVWYTDSETERKLRFNGKRFSLSMLSSKIKTWVQKFDEQKLYELFKEDFLGYEEPKSLSEMLMQTAHYLPQGGAIGEMVLNIAKAVYFYNKGVDGIVDISPFTCMNGIVCEAIYPRVSRDCDNIPIKNFYFDETQCDLHRDVGIFIELAKTYQKNKVKQRIVPRYFYKSSVINQKRCENVETNAAF